MLKLQTTLVTIVNRGFCFSAVLGIALFSIWQSSACWAKEAVHSDRSDRVLNLLDQTPPALSVSLAGDVDSSDFAVPSLPQTHSRETGAILQGAGLLTRFRQKGPYWVSRVQIRQDLAYPGECTSTHIACKLPEVLFFDSVAKKRVMSLSAVGPGSWFLDYTTGTVYIGDDPTGYTVELSLSGYAAIMGERRG